MKLTEFISNNISNLEHFIEQGGYPINTHERERKELLEHLPQAFKMDAGLLHCDTSKIPSKVMAAFWKYKYMEALQDANRMRDAIDEAYRKVNS